MLCWLVQIVKPKRDQLKVAEEKLEGSKKELAAKKAQLQCEFSAYISSSSSWSVVPSLSHAFSPLFSAVMDLLADLKKQYETANATKRDLEAQVGFSHRRMDASLGLLPISCL